MFKYAIRLCSHKIGDDCWSPEVISVHFANAKLKIKSFGRQRERENKKEGEENN